MVSLGCPVQHRPSAILIAFACNCGACWLLQCCLRDYLADCDPILLCHADSRRFVGVVAAAAASFDQQETEQARLFLSQRLAKATHSLNESTNRNVLLKVWDRLAVNRAKQVARRLEVACVCIQQQTALCEKTITIWRRCMLRMRRNAKTAQRFLRHVLAARTLRRWVAYGRRARIRARAVAVPVAARSGMVLRWWY